MEKYIPSHLRPAVPADTVALKKRIKMNQELESDLAGTREAAKARKEKLAQTDTLIAARKGKKL